jgi:hypothetical protein
MWQHFTDGIRHITDISGYDHMLFLLALCAPYTWKQWKPVVLLATAFTLGHSISLALAAFGVVRFSSYYIELLIPASIVITALTNISYLKHSANHVPWTRYVVTTIFGIIHGLGFSSFFRMIYDETSSLVKSLLLFNLGVEVGQLAIIGVILTLAWLLVQVCKVNNKVYNGVLSLIALGLGVWLFIEKL